MLFIRLLVGLQSRSCYFGGGGKGRGEGGGVLIMMVRQGGVDLAVSIGWVSSEEGKGYSRDTTGYRR